jgi:hypothetical protein
MTDNTPKSSKGHPRKQFHIPPDIARLGSYATTIIAAMKQEHQRRMSR